MVVEHVFVTTREGGEALDLASRFLVSRGFQRERTGEPAGPDTADGKQEATFSRGTKSAARAAGIEELPQRLRVHYDRGRVTFAASLQPFSKKKRHPECERYLADVAICIEQLLTLAEDDPTAAQTWERIDHHHRNVRDRQRGTHWVALLIIVIVVATIVTVAIALAS